MPMEIVSVQETLLVRGVTSARAISIHTPSAIATSANPQIVLQATALMGTGSIGGKHQFVSLTTLLAMTVLAQSRRIGV